MVAVARPGDASLRSAEDFFVVSAMPEMQVESSLFSTNAVVAWLDGDRHEVSCCQVADEIVVAQGARAADVEVVKHYPERLFIRFMHQNHCVDVVSTNHLLGSGYRIFVCQWRLEAHAENEDMLQHVRPCMEGVPLHGWNEYDATFLIGHRYLLDYMEPCSRRKEDTRGLALWAWTADLGAIPKVKWLTLRAAGKRRRGHRGLRHHVIIHLDLLEDHSKAGDDDDNPPPSDVHEFTWYSKTIDGTFIPRERKATPGRIERCQDRRDDNDDRDGRRGRDDGHAREGWGARVRRSLSRNMQDRQREDGHGRTRVRSGGRRHVATSSDPVPAPVAGLRGDRALARRRLSEPSISCLFWAGGF
ncbi:hypothetical protein D1007_31040 [Hordeum vulgare]|nr:hypothetical protein D1007_31040 [Hordeum vulgare]